MTQEGIQRFDDIADWFENLSPQTLAQIDCIYAENATFIDPFNAVHDRVSIHDIYAHMFKTLEQPAFKITRKIVSMHQGCMVWRFTFKLKKRVFDIEGSTVFEINEQGLITLHRDYWDTSRELYEHVPILGYLLKRLRLALSTPKKKTAKGGL
ncbi:MAG: nuclear transport factor 2 family protein [Burkholderiaceae bacterium]|jgi:steroid Delta-isomerase|nr:nuclear transport factor 2 family protein [Burkholderiaceae bacterium]